MSSQERLFSMELKVHTQQAIQPSPVMHGCLAQIHLPNRCQFRGQMWWETAELEMMQNMGPTPDINSNAPTDRLADSIRRPQRTKITNTNLQFRVIYAVLNYARHFNEELHNTVNSAYHFLPSHLWGRWGLEGWWQNISGTWKSIVSNILVSITRMPYILQQTAYKASVKVTVTQYVKARYYEH